MQDLADKYKSAQYEERYEKAVARGERLAALVSGWVAYAKRMSEVRALQAESEEVTESNVQVPPPPSPSGGGG